MRESRAEEDLILRALDGELLEHEESDLAARVKHDPQAARLMVELARQESMLVQAFETAAVHASRATTGCGPVADEGVATGPSSHAIPRAATVPSAGRDFRVPVSVPSSRRNGRRWPLFVAAAAAAAILVATGLHVAGLMPTRYTSVDLFNVTASSRTEKLYDGTVVTVAPNAKAIARGRDDARGIRQLILLREGSISVKAPKAPPGETAVRVETSQGMWVETVGTTFTVTRTYENEKGERNMNPSKLVGIAAAVLVVAVSEGEVRTGNAGAEETRVAARDRTVVRPAGREALPKPFRIVEIPKREHGYSNLKSMTIRSNAELKRLLQKIAGQGGWNRRKDFEAAVSKAAANFKDETLVLLRHTEGSGSVQVSLAAPIFKDRALTCRIEREAPEEGTADMAYYCFALAVSRHRVKEVVLKARGREAARLAIAVEAEEKIAWGQAVNRLAVGLSASQDRFEIGRPILLNLHLKNVGKVKINVFDALSQDCWRVTFAGDNARRFELNQPRALKKKFNHAVLAAGLQARAKLSTSGLSFRPLGGGKNVLDLPPGKYRVAATCSNPSVRGPGPKYWAGAVVSGALEIEIVAPDARKIAWGKVVNGLQAGLSVKQARLIATETTAFTVHARSVDERVIVLAAVDGDSWRLDFKSEDGGTTYRLSRPAAHAPTAKVPVVPDSRMAPGAVVKWVIPVGRERGGISLFRVLEKDVPPLKALPPGKYTVTASYGVEPRAVVRHWTGRITTGAVKIEVVAPTGAAGLEKMLNKKVDLNLNDVELDFLMNTLHRLSGIGLVFEAKDLKGKQITVLAEGSSVRAVLDVVVAKHTDLQWKVVGKSVVVGRKTAAPRRR